MLLRTWMSCVTCAVSMLVRTDSDAALRDVEDEVLRRSDSEGWPDEIDESIEIDERNDLPSVISFAGLEVGIVVTK